MSRLRSWVSTHRRAVAAGALVVAAAGAVLAATVLAAGDGGTPRVSAPTPPSGVTHGPLSEGWEAATLALPDDTFSLRALSVSDAGVAPDSAFELTSKGAAIASDRLGSLLRVEPRIEFDVDRRGERTVRIKPRAALQRETSYRFTLRDPVDGREVRSWAFQTESPLRVAQTLPADRATGVPAATGIELTFTRDGVTGVEQRFRIDPPVEGRFETHKRVVVFVPDRLEYRTVYTVTLDAGVTAGALASEEPFTFSFETGSLDEREPYVPPPSFVRLLNEASTSEAPALQFMSYQPPAGDVSVEVYRYDGLDAFRAALEQAQAVPQWSTWGRRNFRLDASDLERAASFTAQTVEQRRQYWSAPYVIFPEPLAAGLYLVQATDSTQTGAAQALLQVTDLAAYAAVSETKTLVWVNDLATKAPVKGAQVEDGEGNDARTDGDGVAFFDTPRELLPEETPGYYSEYGYGGGPNATFTVQQDGRVVVVPLRDGSPIGFGGYRGGLYGQYSTGYSYSGANGEFWNYAYTDRRLYRKDDEVRVWGIAKRRDGFDDGEPVTLRISGGDGRSYGSAPIAETTAELTETGTFEATLPLTAASPGYYNVLVSIGDETVTSTYFRVEDFVKPAYAIDVTPSQRAAINGDVVTFDIATRFFDGSPAPFTEVILAGDAAAGQPELVTTDENGLAAIRYTAVADSQYLQSRYLYVRPAGPEEGEISGQASVYVLPSSVAFASVEGGVDRGEGIVRGRLDNVDLTAFERDDRTYSYYGFYGESRYVKDPAPGVAVSARVFEVSYTKRETGSTYDFIAKLTRKTYEYTPVEIDRGTVPATTGSDGSFEVRFAAGPDTSYRVELSAPDARGRMARATAWVSSTSLPYLGATDEPVLLIRETDVRQDPQSYAYVPPKRYGAGDAVDLSLSRGREPAEERPDVRYLFYRARSGIRGYDVQPASRYVFAFESADAPSLVVGGVQFNGRGYEAFAGDYAAQYDFETRRIDVRITSDRERYGPGEEVTLSVETRDAAGDPVAAETLLSGVDEALLRLQGEQYDDMLETLYQRVGSGLIAVYVPSFAAVDPSGSGTSPGQPGGGPATGGVAPPATGPGADPRKDFRDNAIFQTVRTDKDGRGSVTFKLPDNITSWRVAARAVDSDLRAGSGETSVPVGLPFFVEATIATEYLTGDRPVIALRSYGLDLARGADVRYRVRIPSLGVDELSASGKAFERAEIALPPLAEGVHEVTIEAQSGERRDAIVRQVRVRASRLQRAEASYAALGDGVTLEGAEDGRTTVVFSDQNRGRYYDDVSRLSWTWGDRVDQMLARTLSRELLVAYYGAPEDETDARFDAALYQTDDGGIALFPYADDDLVLSARIASLASERFSRGELAAYFQRILDDREETRERTIIALFGLASAGAPALSQLEYMAAQPDLTVRERLYLGLAALAAGDEAIAREQYRQVLLGFGEKREPYVRIRTGAGQDDILEATVLAADLAAGLGDGSADALFAYTMENRATDLLVELDQISYLARALPRLPSEPSTFSYTLRGSRTEQQLAAGASFALSLTPAELRDLAPRTVAGAVGVATFYEAPFDLGSVPRDPDISLTRTIVGGGIIAQGALVQIRADYVIGAQALDGCYQITVFTPSGLRPVSRAQDPRQIYEPNQLYPYIIDGQRVSFCAYGNSPPYPAVYWARVVTPGEYVVEPAIMQSQQSTESFAATDGERITIR